MIALLEGLRMNTKDSSLGEETKQDFFFNIKERSGSAELSQCDCKYHFYGIKLGIGCPDRFVSSLILHVSHSVCKCVRLDVRM